jgi:hypothetical protein
LIFHCDQPSCLAELVYDGSEGTAAEPKHQDHLERYPDGYTCHYVRPHLEAAEAGGQNLITATIAGRH